MARRLGTLLVTAGLLVLVWAVVVWRWQDPFTALYTTYEQHELAHSYDRRAAGFRPPPLRIEQARGIESSHRDLVLAEQHAIAREARSYRLDSHDEEALGRIVVPHLGLNMVFVDGTSEGALAKGPGRDLQTFMPGEGRLVYIAGHRTTFLAPFADINVLVPGDRITLELPYATFVYRVTGHVIVAAGDLSVLRPGHRELLALQACNPRFFATQRYIVYAKPVLVVPAENPRMAYRPG